MSKGDRQNRIKNERSRVVKTVMEDGIIYRDVEFPCRRNRARHINEKLEEYYKKMRVFLYVLLVMNFVIGGILIALFLMHLFTVWYLFAFGVPFLACAAKPEKPELRFPYLLIKVNVSGKRDVKPEDIIDNYLINHGMDVIDDHLYEVNLWKEDYARMITDVAKPRDCEYYKSVYENIVDDDGTVIFIITRHQTRYQQYNYNREAYRVEKKVHTYSCGYDVIADRYERLDEIGFESTLRQYDANEQRKLMTKELKDFIKERDNYTCQICGKYMPDEVGLHVDHIIPVSKGGKSVQSNLQVLCSKCNGRKSNREVTNE